jgi:glycogen debranching enzyme
MKKRVGDDWLIYNSGYVGTCVVAGHQDYPFYFGGDTEVSIAGLLAAGLHDTAKESLRLLGAVGKKQNGRIPHCVVTNGEVYDWGNIGESFLFLKAVWDTYLWTGDEKFLKEIYPICKMAIDYVLRQPEEDGILLQETGDNPDSPRAKIIPIGGTLGHKAFANIAERIGDNESFKKSISTAAKMRCQIDDLFWVEDKGFYASRLDQDNNPIISSSVDDENNYNPAGTIEAAYFMEVDKSRILRALSEVESRTHRKFKLGKGAYMPYSFGKAAVGEFNYKRLEEGLWFLRLISKTIGHIMPGAAPETLYDDHDPKKFLPGWCYLQLWSASHINQGLIWGLLHIEPDAARKKVVIQPQLPKDWAYAEFKNIMIGKSKINVRLEKEETLITQTKGPKLEVILKE